MCVCVCVCVCISINSSNFKIEFKNDLSQNIIQICAVVKYAYCRSFTCRTTVYIYIYIYRSDDHIVKKLIISKSRWHYF